MYTLRIEHKISDYDSWKKAFESDPVGRKKMGVLQYRISRPVEDKKYIIIDLEFDKAEQAEALLAAMRVVWGNVAGKIIMDPQAKITEVLETKTY